MARYRTSFGSLDKYEKGRVEVIDDDPKNYAFSNVFEICSSAAPYEKVVFGLNQIYVLEAIRAEGRSPWYSCAHDEFALCMDGEVEIHLFKLDQAAVPEDQNGAVALPGEPVGRPMGRMRLRRGHQGMLPAQCAYQFHAPQPAVIVLQTCKGELSVERWEQICSA